MGWLLGRGGAWAECLLGSSPWIDEGDDWKGRKAPRLDWAKGGGPCGGTDCGCSDGGRVWFGGGGGPLDSCALGAYGLFAGLWGLAYCWSVLMLADRALCGEGGCIGLIVGEGAVAVVRGE